MMTNHATHNGTVPEPLNPAQERTFDHLLSVGLPRPHAEPALADTLNRTLEGASRHVAERWTEPRLFVTKSLLATVYRCEGQSLADAERRPDGNLPLPAAVGIVAHRAIQVAHTHPGQPVGHYVDMVLADRSDDTLNRTLDDAAPLAVSDLRTKAVERVAGFLDTWPPLDERWTPRFEASLQAKVGGLTLAARPDLMLGRPRSDHRQTMLLVDFKSGALHDGHADEALFYALVATLRFGVPPFRSTVYSLSSGEMTDPDVDAARLTAAADWVAEGVRRIVDVRTAARTPHLTPGRHCSWCPASTTCPAADPTAGAGDGQAAGQAAAGRTATPASAAAPEPSLSADTHGRFALDPS